MKHILRRLDCKIAGRFDVKEHHVGVITYEGTTFMFNCVNSDEEKIFIETKAIALSKEPAKGREEFFSERPWFEA